VSRRALPQPGTPRVMGVLNLTPDSFSDGGTDASPADAVARGVELAAQGAAVIDVGAVSARPGAEVVSAEAEWARIEPVLGPLRAAVDVPISLETCRAEVLAAALEVGVDLVNDVSMLAGGQPYLELVAEAGLPLVLMHTRGTPATMQHDPRYDDAPAEVRAELAAAVRRAVDAGVAPGQILLDPGIGFGKTAEHNLALLASLPELVALGHRTVLGCSRKSFLGRLTGRGLEHREHATTATTVLGALAGIDFLRVHDVAAAVDALAVVAAVGGARRHRPLTC
jgi:dihydropteroate synthase